MYWGWHSLLVSDPQAKQPTQWSHYSKVIPSPEIHYTHFHTLPYTYTQTGAVCPVLEAVLQCTDESWPTLTWSLANGRVKSPCSRPFFSINTTLYLLGCRWVQAIRLPEGLETHKKKLPGTVYSYKSEISGLKV